MDNPFDLPSVDEILRRKLQEQSGASLPPLTPPEADSLLGQVAGAGLGALHYVGSTLDKTFGGRKSRYE